MRNLPLQTMPFIGRDDEIVAITRQLADPACSLLTLVAPGGMGKTRLAIEVVNDIARTYPPADGIYFVDLQPVNSGDLLVDAVANALGMLISGVESPRSQLLSYLNGRDSLLLLDNFEQLLGSVDLLADIIKIAPNIKLLVTSREALNIQEEWVWQISGLQVPGQHPEANIESYSAVQLFVDRARRSRQNFTLIGQESFVTRTCQLVEGMPLALELAASWTKALSCAEIATEIQRGLNFLTTTKRNVLERHQSMQAVFDHSWRFLTEAERQAFLRLTVFRGGFQREAAQRVADASLAILAGLVDKSFLRVSTDGRYSIQELLRQYGDEHLIALPDAKQETQHRHAVYYAGFLHQLEWPLRNPEQGRALDEIGAELNNIRESWQWAVDHGMRDEIQHSMHSFYLFCHIRSQAVDGERLFDMAFRCFEHEESALIAYLSLARISMAWHNGKQLRSDQFLKSIQLAYTYCTDDNIALLFGGNTSFHELINPNERIEDHFQERLYCDFLELYRTRGQTWGAAFMLMELGWYYQYNSNFDQSERCFRESLDTFLRLGDSWASAWSTNGLAVLYDTTRRYPEALEMIQQHQDACAAVGDWGGVVYALAVKAELAIKLHDISAARSYLIQAIKRHLESGSQLAHLSYVLQAIYYMFMDENKYEAAVEILSFMRHYTEKVQAADVKSIAEQLLSEVAQKLPSEIYRQALERGKKLHLRSILKQLEAEWAEDTPSSQNTVQIDVLSERELEVLRLTALGYSNRQIAHELVLTLNTVKSHIHHIYGKLGVASRTQAVARARELNLL